MTPYTYPSCLPSCPKQHLAFEVNRGDRIAHTFEHAVEMAHRKIGAGHGRQRISRHVGAIFRSGVWIVQDIR